MLSPKVNSATTGEGFSSTTRISFSIRASDPSDWVICTGTVAASKARNGASSVNRSSLWIKGISSTTSYFRSVHVSPLTSGFFTASPAIAPVDISAAMAAPISILFICVSLVGRNFCRVSAMQAHIDGSVNWTLVRFSGGFAGNTPEKRSRYGEIADMRVRLYLGTADIWQKGMRDDRACFDGMSGR